MPTATTKPIRQEISAAAAIEAPSNRAVHDKPQCTHAAYVTASFAVATRTRLQREKSLAQIEDQETTDGQREDSTTGPAALACSVNGFR